MRFDGDTRGQPVLIGAILLFAILIIAFSSYQAFVIPSQNAEVEFSHSQQIENEFSEFRSNVVNAIEGNDERSTSFTLGTQYPSRLIALNPPAAAGALSTTEPGEVSLYDDDGEIDMNDVCGIEDATSRSLVYEPQYNEYTSAQSTVYEHTFVGTTFRDGQSFPQSQRMIREDGVYLTLLTGSVSESRSGSVGVDINATHRSPAVEGVTSVTIPSEFDNETWENQILSGQENVDSVKDAGDGRVEIILSEALDVSCAVVGLDSDPEFTPPQPESEPGEPRDGVSPAYDISWDTTRMDDFAGFGCSGSTCKIGTGESESVAIETTDQIGGFAEFAVGDTNIGDFSEYSSEFENSELLADPEITFNANENLGETDAFVFAGDGRDRLTIEVTGFAVEIVETNSPVNEEETLQVTVEVTNTGAAQSTQDIELLDFGGAIVATESVTLDGGDSREIVLEWNTQEGDAGTDNITVQSEDDSDTVEVTINAEDEPAPPFFDVTIDTTNSPVTEGETLTVDATIENTGEQEGTQDIELLDFGGTVVATESVTLDGGESTTVVLEWGTEVGDAGTDEITVQSEDDSDSATVTVEEEEYDIEITNLEDSGGGNPNWYDVSWSATVPDGETVDIRLSFDGAQGETVVERTGSHDDTQRLDRDGGNPDAIVIEIISDGTVVASDQVDV